MGVSMARNVLVQCICDFCGETVYCRANYNIHHHLYEDGLPEVWEYIDNLDYKLISHGGDHCPRCLTSFSKYIDSCLHYWMKYVRFKNNIIPQYTANSDEDLESSL